MHICKHINYILCICKHLNYGQFFLWLSMFVLLEDELQRKHLKIAKYNHPNKISTE